MPMGNELKWLLKEGGGCIFDSCDISLPHTSSYLCVYAVIFCQVLAYAITANGTCLYSLVPPLTIYCFFSVTEPHVLQLE